MTFKGLVMDSSGEMEVAVQAAPGVPIWAPEIWESKYWDGKTGKNKGEDKCLQNPRMVVIALSHFKTTGQFFNYKEKRFSKSLCHWTVNNSVASALCLMNLYIKRLNGILKYTKKPPNPHDL